MIRRVVKSVKLLSRGFRKNDGLCEATLSRLFSTFPDGLSGFALLLLRALLGVTAVMQGGIYLSAKENSTSWTWIAGLAALIFGVALMIGLLTPLAALIVFLETLLTRSDLSPLKDYLITESALSIAYICVTAAVVALLGPGAFSLDARLFGRREIIIPEKKSSPEPQLPLPSERGDA